MLFSNVVIVRLCISLEFSCQSACSTMRSSTGADGAWSVVVSYKEMLRVVGETLSPPVSGAVEVLVIQGGFSVLLGGHISDVLLQELPIEGDITPG